MGLNWTKPIKVKNDKFILVSSEFPSTDLVDHDLLWYIWKRCKGNIKKDGIEVQKDGEIWYIIYTHEITSESDNRVTPGKRYWQHERDMIIEKWTGVYEGMARALLDNTDPKREPREKIPKPAATAKKSTKEKFVNKTPPKRPTRQIEPRDEFEDFGEEIPENAYE